MGSRALFLLRGIAPPSSATHHRHLLRQFPKSTPSQKLIHKEKEWVNRSFSVKSSLEAPDLNRLAQTARISLSPAEVEEFAPKIQQVVDWFGQLQSVDLESIDPAIRAAGSPCNSRRDFHHGSSENSLSVLLVQKHSGIDVGSFRDDLPETFENRDAMIASVPSYDEPYIKVPKVLKEE